MIMTDNSTPIKPLAFFEGLILQGKMKDLYLSHCNEVDTFGGTWADNPEVSIIHLVDKGETDGIRNSFHPAIVKMLEAQKQLAFQNIDDRVSTFNSTSDIIQFTDTVFHSLNYLSGHINQAELYQQAVKIREILDQISNYLVNRYHNTTIKRDLNLPTDIESNEPVIYDDLFGFKLNVNRIPQLYNTLVDIEFFNEEDEQLDLFKAVLTNRTSKDEGRMLKIACSVEQAAYTFRKLEVLFHKLSFKNIEQSCLFMNKRDKVITATDLSKALTNYNRKINADPEIKIEIDNAIGKFL